VEIKPLLPLKEIEERKVFNLQKALLEERGSMAETVLVFVGTPYFDQKTFEHSYKILGFGGFTLSGNITDKELKDRGQKWVHCPLCKNMSLSFYQLDRHIDLIINDSKIIGSESLGIDSLYCGYCCCLSDEDLNELNWKQTDRTWHRNCWVETKDGWHITMSPKLMNAYLAARQAQFENGETPQIL
jgi:hypothetical protein